MILFLLAACAGVRGDLAEGLVLNELLAMNVASNTDEMDQFDDWLEIFNGSDQTVALEGLYLSDDPSAPSRWALPMDESIEPGAHLVVWCDGEPEQGALHAPFKLGGTGESVVLSFIDGEDVTMLDQVDFGEQLADTAWARKTDGAVEWIAAAPTPGKSNGK